VRACSKSRQRGAGLIPNREPQAPPAPVAKHRGLAGPAAVVRLGAIGEVVVVVDRLRTAIFQGGLEPEFCLAPAFSRPIRRGTPLGVSQNRQKLQEFLLVRLARCGKVELEWLNGENQFSSTRAALSTGGCAKADSCYQLGRR